MHLFASLRTLALKELAVLARDRQAAALLFGMPAAFVFLLSLALKDVYGEKVGGHMKVVLEDEDAGEYAERIAGAIRERAEFELVTRPAGEENASLFRKGDARAAVRIPAGFSEDARDFLSTPEGAELDRRIEWEASPTLDAPYRWFLEARLALLCMKVVQDELIRQQTEMGGQLEELGERLEETGAELERTGTQLETLAVLMRGTPAELEGMAVAAMLETAAAEEAVAAREFLAAQGLSVEADPRTVPPVELVPVVEPPAREASEERLEPAPFDASHLRRERAAPVEATLSLDDMGAVPETPVPQPDAPGDGAAPAGTAVAADEHPFLREGGGERDTLPSPLQQTVPGWSLFAMFFIVVPLSHGLHRERAEGTLRRIRALAVPPSAIVLGKLVPYVLVGVVQFAGMLAVGLWLVPLFADLALDLGEKPWVLVPITLVCALAATSYALLVASLTRTPEQAAAFGATSIIILSVLGGVMVPHFVMPALLQDMARISPLYWGHKAYLDAFLHGAGLKEVSQALGALLVFAALCLAVASRRIAR